MTSALPAALRRYLPLVDDPAAFAAALERPLPPVVWGNPLRTDPGRLATLLEDEGMEPRRLGWCPGAFRLAAGSRPGRGLLALTGLYHVQGEASLLPVELLDPQPDERVLDLCAAPGGKTARIAAAMGNRGTVVANDVDWRRLVALGRNVDRLGLANVAVTAWDAANFPGAAGPFDRVLADVPCTCEGTSRKNPEALTWGGAGERRASAAVQKAILRRAVRLCRPGGRIVYSTCTFAPEENEAVVSAILAELPGALDVVESRLDGFTADAGVSEWEGRALDPRVGRTLRIWPQRHDTGGFFVAVLRRTEGGGGGGARERPERTADREPFLFDRVEPGPCLGPVIERFGFPEEAFVGLRPVRRGSKTLALVSEELAPPARPEPRSWGLPFLHAAMRRPKLTTAAAMAFGAAARSNAVDLGSGMERGEARERAEAYVLRRDVALAADEAAAMTGDGYAIVRWRGVALGVGWYRASGRSLRSLYPKRWAVSV